METKIIKRKGKCQNSGPCSKANSEEIQIITDPFAEFICSECGLVLEEIMEEKSKERSLWFSNKKLITVIFTSVIILGIYLIINQLSLSPSNADENLTLPIDTTGHTVMTNNTNDSMKVPPTPIDITKQTDTKVVTSDKEKNLPPTQTITDKVWKTINFPNGDRYVGETKNGLMHGAGAYYFKESQIISKKDLKKRYAEAGDILKGNWFEGSFTNGKQFDKNEKFKETIIVGQ